MPKTTVVPLRRLEVSRDALSEILRSGARQLLAEAINAEVEAFLAEYREEQDEAGQQRIVRNGYLPEREIQTGLGGVPVRVPRVRDRAASNGEGLQFRSKIVPPYLRRAKSIEELLPWLYLRGISTGDFLRCSSCTFGPGRARALRTNDQSSEEDLGEGL